MKPKQNDSKPEPPRRRRTDSALGQVIDYCVSAWDFIDRRDIDKHAVSLAVLWGTWTLTVWAMEYSATFFTTTKSGIEVAAVIAAVTAPYLALQAAAIKWYFESRSA